MYCKILSPDNTYVPTLPLRLKDGRTVSNLCRSCSEKVNIAEPRSHLNRQRGFEGLGLHPFYRKLLRVATKLKEMYEIHHFLQRRVKDPAGKCGEIFAQFILALMQKKNFTSGFPCHVVTHQQKKNFGQEYDNALGVVYQPEVSDNAGAQYAAKVATMQPRAGTLILVNISYMLKKTTLIG